jgi:hypothetical protein
MACGSERIVLKEKLEEKLISLRIETLQTQLELQSIQIAELEAKTSSKKVVVKLPESKPKEPPSEGEKFTIVLGESELVAKKIPKAPVAVTTDPISETESDSTTTSHRSRATRKTISTEERCCAIVDRNNCPERCSQRGKVKVNDMLFCSTHKRKALETTEPCCYNEDGKHFGLFMGTTTTNEIDMDTVPFHDKDGLICIRWAGPECLVERLKNAIKEGAKYNPFSPEGGAKRRKKTSVVKVGTNK